MCSTLVFMYDRFSEYLRFSGQHQKSVYLNESLKYIYVTGSNWIIIFCVQKIIRKPERYDLPGQLVRTKPKRLLLLYACYHKAPGTPTRLLFTIVPGASFYIIIFNSLQRSTVVCWTQASPYKGGMSPQLTILWCPDDLLQYSI